MAKKKLTLEDVLVPKDKIPYEVPENWCWTRLQHIGKWSSGGTPKSTIKEYYDGDIPWLIIADLNDGYVSESNKSINTLGLENSSAKIIEKDSVLVAMYGSIGKLGINTMTCACNQAIAYMKEQYNIVDNKYLFYYLLSQRDYLNSLGKGGTQQNISLTVLNKVEIPIPPLAEQVRIVNSIESLFDKVDKATGLVDEARNSFEKRRSSILERAFSGELTNKWREVNDFSVESILFNIENLNKDEKKKFEFSEARKIFDVPSNWKWMKLKDLCTKFKYGTAAKSQSEGRVPVLRMGNLQGGVIDWNNLVYTSNEDEIKKYDLIKGDLLFNRTNSPELVGKTSIYMGEKEAIYAGYLIRVRTYEDVNSKYVNYFMNSTFAKARCYEVKTDGVSQSNINAEKLGDFDIPLPSIEEQDEIVRILDRLLDKERGVTEILDVFNSIDVIKKSILAKVFRGDLGSNDLYEESSTTLINNLIK